VRGDGLAGLALPAFGVTVDRDRVRAFCVAIGEIRPMYRDVDAARAGGHPDLLVPPTYLFALEFERPQPYLALERLDARLSSALHAEQAFDYVRPCHAGDRLDFEPIVASYSESTDGRLGFVRRETTVLRERELVARLTNVLAIRWDAA
jgi:acyl dehydratase